MALNPETKKIQQELNEKFTTDDPLKYMFSRMSKYHPTEPAQADLLSKSVFYAPKDSRRFSRFFGEVYDPTQNIEDVAAGRQSSAEKLGMIIPRIGIKVASEIAQMPGYLGGVVAWGSTGFDPDQVGMMIDNFWIKGVQAAEEATKSAVAPVFVSDEVKQGGLMKNILSPEFWATEGADGIGFLLAFLAPGQALKTAKLGAKAARLIKPGAKATAAFKAGLSAEEATAIATKGLAENIDLIGATAINTLFESAAEGGETYRDVLGRTNNSAVAGEAAVDVIKKNFGILLLSNAVDQYWLFKDINMFKMADANAAEKLTKKGVMDKLIDPKTGKRLSEVAERSKWAKAGVLTRDFLTGIGKEGFYEEGMQFAASKQAAYKAENPEVDDAGFLEELVNLGETYIENLSDTDMQKSIFLGGFLGGGMSTIRTNREWKAEERLLKGSPGRTASPFTKFFGAKDRKESPGLKQLLDRSFASFNDTFMDLVVKESDAAGNLVPVLVQDPETGKYVYKTDPDKVSALAEDKLLDFAEKEQLMNYAREGNEEGFRYIKEKMDFKRMSIYLSQPNGITALLRNLDEWATLESENFKKEGLTGVDVDTIKNDLKRKALKFQSIYDRLDKTHDLAMLDVKVEKEDRAAFVDFSSRAMANKISEEVRIEFADERINVLRNTLSNEKIPITSAENNLSDKLIPELRQAIKDKADTMSKLDKKYAEKIISDLEIHQRNLKQARDFSASLYDKKFLNEAFEGYLAKKKDQKDSPVSGEKAKEAMGLGPKLKALFDKSVIMEEITEPTRSVVRHTGELEVVYTDETGKSHTVVGEIGSKTDTGNLQFRVKKAEQTNKDGKVKTADVDLAAFLNEDETFAFSSDKIHHKIASINVVKTPQEVQSERMNQALLESLKNALSDQRQKIGTIKNNIKLQREYIEELKSKLLALKTKEVESLRQTGSKLTAKQTARKESVQVELMPTVTTKLTAQAEEDGKRRKRMFLDTNELTDQLAIANKELIRLRDILTLFQENKTKIEDYIAQAKKDGNYIKSFDELKKIFTDVVSTTNQWIDSYEDSLSSSQQYLTRVRNTLKGYYTTFANILGISTELNALRTNLGLTEDQRDEAIVKLVADTFNTTELTDAQYAALGTLPTNIERIRQLIQKTEQDINDLTYLISNNRAALKEFDDTAELMTLLFKKYQTAYHGLASDLGILEDITDKKTLEAETPEDSMDDIREQEARFRKNYEEYFLHPFSDKNSWLVSGGNQDNLKEDPTNEDLARWYIFVNKMAFADHNSKYIFRNYSYDMVSALEPDDVIRKNLKFYVGKVRGKDTRATYDEINKMSIEQQNIAKEDIKIVVYTVEGKPLMVSKQVIDDSDKKYYILYNSLPEHESSAMKFKRFSLKKLEDKILLDKFNVKRNGATDEQLIVVKAEAKKVYDESFPAYLKDREDFKKNAYYFGIKMINPGVPNDEEIEELDVLDAFGVKDVRKMGGADNFTIHQARKEDTTSKKKYGAKLTREVSGAPTGKLSGYLYVYKDNHSLLVKPKTLAQTGSVEEVLNIIKYLATNPRDYIGIEKYLHKILYINASSKEFKLLFTKFYGAEKSKHGFRSLVFDGKSISAEKLVRGEGLEELRSFLETKYWNFNDSAMKETAFTEFTVNWNDGKPSVMSKVWSPNEGGYLGFLFNPAKNKISKGTVRGTKPKESPLDTVKSGGQYINQSISLTAPVKSFKQLSNTPAAKAEANPKTTAGEKATGAPKAKGRTLGDKLREGSASSDPTGTPIKQGKSLRNFGGKAVGIKTEGTSAFSSPAGTTDSKYSNAKSLWDSKDTPAEVKKGLIELYGSEEIAMEERYKSYNSKTGSINRRITEIDNYAQEDFDARVKWYSSKFPQIPIEQVKSILMGNSWGKLTSAGRTLISDTAAEGTIYHEGYHTYSLIFLSPERRQALYDEARRRTGRKMNDNEVEEFLAEEFRDFMSNPEGYKFNKGSEVKQSWFRELLDRILDFLGFGIEKNFATIRDTKEFIVEPSVLEDRIKNIVFDRNYTRTEVIADLTEKQIMHYVQDFNYIFFQKLFDPKSRTNPDTIFDLDVGINDLYTDIKAYYLSESTNNSHEKTILDNFEGIKKEHQKYLKLYGIEISGAEKLIKIQERLAKKILIDDQLTDKSIMVDDLDDIKGDDHEKDSLSIMDANMVDMSKLIDRPIRMLIAGLPNVSFNNGMIKPTMSELGTRSTIAYTQTIRVLQDSLSKLTSVDDMIAKLVAISDDTRYPAIKYLLKRLGVDEDGTYNNPTTQQTQLMNQFYRLFSLNKGNPLLLNYAYDGRMYFIDAVQDNVKSLISNSWLNNAREFAGKPGYYSFKKSGSYFMNVKDIKKDLVKYTKAGDAFEKQRIGIDVLAGMGIDLLKGSMLVYDANIVDRYLFWLNEELKDKDKPILTRDFYNRDVIRNQTELDALLDYVSRYYLNEKDLSYFNQDGNRAFSVTLNSFLSNNTNLLNLIGTNHAAGTTNVPPEIEHLMGWNSTSETGSLFNRNSIWLDYLKNNEKIKFMLLAGNTTPNQGTEISRAALGDYKSITFNALLKGIVPFMRSADRKLEYGFQIGTVNYEISDKTFTDAMEGYLKDELSTSFALLLDPKNWGGNLVNYSKNAKNLRVFKFVQDNAKVAELSTFVDENADQDYLDARDNNQHTRATTVEEVDRLVKEFMRSHKRSINRSLTDYMKDLERMTIESLREDNVIKISGTKIYVPGLDTETIAKLGIKRSKILNYAELERIVRVATYNSFVGNNEQLKLYLGDLAYYSNAQDFHKRTTGASSTKYNQRDDIMLQNHLNENFIRFDQKIRSESMEVLVVDDIVSQNAELAALGKEFEDYNKVKGTDAQSWSTLDEYRDIMLRHGMWYPRHEKTYQYEQQKLAIRLIKLDKETPFSKDELRNMFESKNGMFYKHTKGIVPAVPMYNGQEMKESEMAPLTILKPQGFGHIANIKGIAATQFFKTSTAPIFMSAINEDSPVFDFILNMMKNQQSIFTFKSAMKTEIVGDETGKVQKLYETDEYVTQSLRYRDIGIQLDIHEETEGEVSVSSQRTRLEFLDIFDQGTAVKSDELAKQRHEYTEITSNLERTLKEQFVDELGIVHDEGNNTFSLPEKNRDKFKKRLLAAFENRLLPLNVVDGVELALSKKEGLNNNDINIFDATISKFKIEEVLTSMIRNTLIKRKIFGEMLIQESAFLYENTNSERLLNFYNKTEDVVTPMDVMIAVPRKLVKWVDSIGGVDVLNAAIARHDTKLLGSDFFEMLTIPVNRIPGQSLSSLDVVRIKKFLPHYHGNKIVVPAETVVKTGSDFDIDKLTCYFSEFTFDKESGKPIYIRDKESVSGMQNNLNKIASKALLNPERFKELISPLDPSYLRNKSENIKKTRTLNEIEQRSGNPTYSDTVHWWYNMQKGYEFWTSKHGVGAVAVHNTAHAVEQNHPLILGNSYIDENGNEVRTNVIPLMFAGQELNDGEYYQSGFIKDSSGRPISKNFAEFLSAFVDAVKDPFIFQITDDRTFNSIAALNRFGKDSSVGIDSIIDLYSQDVIKDYIKLHRANSAQYMLYNQYTDRGINWVKNERLNTNQQYMVVLHRLKKTLNPSKDALIPINYEKSVSYAIEEYINARTAIYKAAQTLYPLDMEDQNRRTEYTETHPDIVAKKVEIDRRMKSYGYTYLSKSDFSDVKAFNTAYNTILQNSSAISDAKKREKFVLDEVESLKDKFDFDRIFKLQVQMLDNYKMYDQLGWNLVTVNSFLRPDAPTGFPRHLASIQTTLIAPHDTIRRRGVFDENSILSSIAGSEENPSLIQQFYQTKYDASRIYSWTSLIHALDKDGNNTIVRDFFEKEIYARLGEPGKRLNAKDREAVLEEVESDFINFLLVRAFGAGLAIKDMQHNYKYLMQGRESVAKQLINLKYQLNQGDNMALDELESTTGNIIKQSQSVAETDTISLFSKAFDVSEWNAMEADMFDFANSSKDNQEFVKSLIFASIFQSGLRKSPISFQEVIPNRILYPIAIKALDDFIALPSEDQHDRLVSFKEQLYRNNVFNTDIVPRSKFIMNGVRANAADKLLKPPLSFKDKNGFFSNTDYVSALYYIADREKDTKSPIGIALYRRVDAHNFEAVSKLGDGMRFKEYYPMATVDELGGISILDSNMYDYHVVGTPVTVKGGVTTEEETSETTEDESSNLTFKVPKKKKSKRIGLIDDSLEEDAKIEGKNDYAKSLNNDTMIHTVLRQIENKTFTPAHKVMARILREEIKTPIKTVIFNAAWREVHKDETTSEYMNGYHELEEDSDVKTKQIGLYEQLSNRAFELAALHEGVHELTRRRYTTSPLFRAKIDSLFNHSRDRILADIEKYSANRALVDASISSPLEFMSYGLSSPTFQNILNSIPAFNEENVKDVSKSVFRDFLETVYSMFSTFFAGNPGTQNDLPYTAFKELVSIVDDIIIHPEIEEIDENLTTEQIVQLTDKTPSDRQFDGRKTNEAELGKGTEDNFAKLYPDYAYLTEFERQAFQEAVDKGEIILACKI